MGKATVTYSCGHRGEVQLTGPLKERERKLDWYRTWAVCPACYKLQREAETARASEGLVPLTGSEKQVKWAGDIRAEFVGRIRARLSRARDDEETKQKALELFLETVNEKTEAGWWIDHRADLNRALDPVYQQKIRAAGLCSSAPKGG